MKKFAWVACSVLMILAGSLLAGKWLLESYFPWAGAVLQTVTAAEQLDAVEQLFDIYVINLDRDQDRLARFTSIMKNAGLSFTRVSAVDGRKLVKEDLLREKVITPRFSALATYGEIGCAMSHRAVWRAASKSKKPYVVIFEDDVDIDGSLLSKLWRLSQSIEAFSFDMLFLGLDQNTRRLCENPPKDLDGSYELVCQYFAESLYSNSVKPRLVTLPIVMPWYSGGAWAYIVPREKIEVVRQAHEGVIDALADREYWNPKKSMRLRAVAPIWFDWYSQASSRQGSRTRQN